LILSVKGLVDGDWKPSWAVEPLNVDQFDMLSIALITPARDVEFRVSGSACLKKELVTRARSKCGRAIQASWSIMSSERVQTVETRPHEWAAGLVDLLRGEIRGSHLSLMPDKASTHFPTQCVR